MLRASRWLWVATTSVTWSLWLSIWKRLMDFVGGAGIEVAGGLVGQQQSRMQHHRARDRDPLLLAARKFGGPPAELVAQPDKL